MVRIVTIVREGAEARCHLRMQQQDMLVHVIKQLHHLKMRPAGLDSWAESCI